MGSGSGRIYVLSLLAVAGVLLSLAVYQVPQPWRAVLVAWLFVCATLGWLVMRLIRHHYEFKALTHKRGERRPKRAAPSEPPRAHFDGLEVVRGNDAAQRYTI